MSMTAWIRKNLFGSKLNGFLTLAVGWLLYTSFAALLDWAIFQSVWVGDAAACHDAGQGGACWAAIVHNYRFMLFGAYPYAEQWRPALSLAILCSLIIAFGWTLNRARASAWLLALAAIWLAGILVGAVLMAGGVFGLTPTPTDQWGGLPITVFLAAVGIAGAFPIGILLALGRRSEKPAVRGLCVAYIELIRGVPLISVLFMAAVMLPLFFQGDVGIDKLGRAQIAIVLFTAAYMAEVVRGGLAAVPKGQFEAALAIGLGRGQAMRLVILPQALKLSAPAMVNSFISTFKDTSLVVVVGVFDLLNATRVALNDPSWRSFQTEGFVFAGLFYWGACYAMSKYSQHLARERGAAQDIAT